MWEYKIIIAQTAEINSSITPPKALDYRNLGAVTRVKDQTTSCGSCWAFASIAALESQHFIIHGQLLNLSQQELVDCSTENGCKGGNPDKAYNYIIEEGISLDRDYPYKATDGECRSDEVPKSDVKVYGFSRIASDQETMKAAINEFGPIYTAINGMPKSFNFYSEGIYLDPECDKTGTNHAVVIVGYGTDKRSKLDYWIVKNSFSSQWGENGYIRMARNNNVTCGITSSPTYPLLIDNGNNEIVYMRLLFLLFLATVALILCCCCCCCYCCVVKCRKRNLYKLC